MNIKYITSGLLAAMIVNCTAFLTSCADDLEVGKNIDESAYSGIYENNAYLRDGKSNLVSKVVELHGETYATTVKMGLSKTPNTATSAKVKIDAAYLETYNKAHNTDFELYPQDLVTFANEGVLTVNANAKSAEVDMTIRAGEGLQDDKTYAIPVAISDQSSDITIKDESAKHCIYLVKDMRNAGDTYKGEDAVKDSEAGRPRVQCNPNVQYLLDNNETFLQPLRRRGVKVLLGLLGNHDITGLAQLSDQGAKDFAREIAQYCKAYNLDGVNYDDEYSNYPDLNNPSLTTPSTAAAARLCYESKLAMPDKLVTVFAYGQMYGVATVDGVDASEWIDIVVPNYGSSAYPIGNMTKKQCAGIAMEFNLGGGSSLTPSTARSLMNNGYGWYMGFAPSPDNYYSIFRRLDGAETLYGSPLKDPTVFYKKNDPTPYQYPDDL